MVVTSPRAPPGGILSSSLSSTPPATSIPLLAPSPHHALLLNIQTSGFYQGSPPLIPAKVSSLEIKFLIRINERMSLKYTQRQHTQPTMHLESVAVRKKVLF